MGAVPNLTLHPEPEALNPKPYKKPFNKRPGSLTPQIILSTCCLCHSWIAFYISMGTKTQEGIEISMLM